MKGVFEKIPGSGIWWVRYADSTAKIRREKAGTKSAAIKLYQKRKTEVLDGKKFPENLRMKVVKFSELADDARAYVKANNRGAQFDGYRITKLVNEFGDRNADIPVADFRAWFDERGWASGTHNRCRSTLSLLYRLGIENKKVFTNPARLLKHKHEDNGRVRFLAPDEETRLRKAITAKYAAHLPEFELAVHTGMRPSEQYNLTWDRVDFQRQLLTIPLSKTGKTRHIPLNSIAVSALKRLPSNGSRVFTLKGYKHWFDKAVAQAEIDNFTWYSLRHTFASRLVMAGVDLRTVAELMGHKTIQMTMRYAHLAPAHGLAAVERLVNPTSPKTSTKRLERVAEIKAKTA
jgi:site-specific recombinase XerD